MSYQKDLIKRAKAYARKHRVSLSYISNYITSNSDLFKRLAEGKTCTMATYIRADALFRNDIPIKELLHARRR